MLYFCPLTVQSTRRFAVCRVCFFGGVEKSQIISDSVMLYSCKKFLSLSNKAYAFITCFVVTLRTSISMVLGRCCVAKIVPAVVRLIFINMVYFVVWPFSRHPQPYKSVSHVFFVSYSNFYSAFFLSCSRDRPHWGSSSQLYFPYKSSRVRLVVKKFSDLLSGEVGVRAFVCHIAMLTPEAGIVKGLA